MIVNVSNRCSDFDTYRSARVRSLFNAEDTTFSISADIPVESGDWSIGLIVGASGSGKTSIARQLFGGGKIVDLYAGWRADAPVVDCIAPNADFDVVTGALAGVGLGDVPSWLKPFNALSNGQQFRAGLARFMCEADGDSIIDEFTSVVDRQIARIGAMAFAKGWRRAKRGRVVLVSCHHDIVEWLQPDWIFDTASGLKKKAILGEDQKCVLTSGRSTEVTGSILSSIII